MGPDRSRVLLLALGYLVAIVPALFAIDWFFVDLGVASIDIDLRDGRGLYGALAMGTFWGSILVMMPAVCFQTVTRITSGAANAKLSRYGVYAGLAILATGLAAGYLFAPEIPGVERTAAPLLFMVGNALGIAALHYAASASTEDAGYKPVVIEKPITRPPVTPALAAQPAPATRPITQPPLTRTPTQQIPPLLRKKLRYVVLSGEVTRAGIDARREDGSSLLVLWRDVVGAVVRRLPDELEATTFMDIVSVKGSTLRILPWTRLTGISVAGVGDERVRSLAGYVATMCTEVQFDPATKAFLEKPEPAAQLKDLAKLAAHDERLS